MRDWLWERPGDAQTLFPRLSPPSRATMEILLARQIDRLRPRLLDAIHMDDSQLSAISPQGKLGALHTPVFLLHGATDDIIPSTETLWLAKDIPKPYLRAALITPAFSHVDPDKHSVWTDQVRLVEFLAGVLRNAD
jgi:pimeloyl-ACP methyl ester carboxylesterase